MATKTSFTEDEIAAAEIGVALVLDALRECFIMATIGIRIATDEGVDGTLAEMAREYGVADGFGMRALKILVAAGIDPPVPVPKPPLDKPDSEH